MKYKGVKIVIKYRDAIIYSFGNTFDYGNGIKIERNIDVVFETLSDLDPNEITIESEQYPSADQVIFDININPIRLHDTSGTAIPTVLNPNQVDLTRSVPDITFGELVTTLKNWFNLSVDFFENEVIIDFVQDAVANAPIKDYSDFEVMTPVRKLQKGNSYLLHFQDISSKDYVFLPVFQNNTIITNSGYKTNEKTTDIPINGYPLPVTFRNGIQTAHAFEQSSDKVQLILYDGTTEGLNLAKDSSDLLLPSVHAMFHKDWLSRRINSQIFEWNFLADSYDLFDKSVKDKINCYGCVHLIKSINKTEISPEIFEVEIETESEV